jgi:hypothetical protein
MADNVTITQGTGSTTTVAAEDISGVMFQKVKLAVGTAGSTSVIPSDATYGLGVDVKRFTAPFQIDPDTAASDAFSRLRVSLPVTLFDSNFCYGLNTFQYEYTTAASGTYSHSATYSAVIMETVTTTDSVTIQSREYLPYTPGKSQLIVMSFNGTGIQTSVTKEIGYGDNDNGVFLQLVDTEYPKFIIRQDGSTTESVAQDNPWNLDPMDGTGASGVNLDWDKVQLLVIDLQWLGVGRVRVGFDIDGVIVWAHEFKHANSFTTTYMQTASLPVRWKMWNSASERGQMVAYCATVLSEGSADEPHAYTFAANSTTAGVASAATAKAILSIRPGGTFNGLVNRARIVPEYIEAVLSSSGSSMVLCSLVYDATFTTTPTWTAANTTHSTVEFTQHAEGGGFAGGVTIWEAFVGVGAAGATTQRQTLGHQIAARLPMTLDAAGGTTSGKTLSLVIQTAVGNGTLWGSMGWKEIR